ncbi:MAG: 23S rRNA (adenine(2503)-C(2))-methyltransferase RlmN [Candidatus Caldatribacteriaceae bacterium]
MEKGNVMGLLPQDLLTFVRERGEPTYRAQQIISWIYEKKVRHFEEMTDLPRHLREALREHFTIGTARVQEHLCAPDGTEKFLFALQDGFAVEGVLIRHRERDTLCISSQVGCPVGCPFCATGKAGFKRNLYFHEMVEEIWWAEKICGGRIRNLVFMGMGEPLLNYDHLSLALRIINAREGFRIGTRRITVSTVGVPENIIRLGKEWREVNLAVSLHASCDELRSVLVPLNRVYSLSQVLKSIREYINLTNRRVTIEYTLWQDVNDSTQDVYNLVRLLEGMMVHVNVIPGNWVEGSPFFPSPVPKIERLVRILREHGIPVTVRKSRGQGIHASCGELYRIWEGEE